MVSYNGLRTDTDHLAAEVQQIVERAKEQGVRTTGVNITVLSRQDLGKLPFMAGLFEPKLKEDQVKAPRLVETYAYLKQAKADGTIHDFYVQICSEPKEGDAWIHVGVEFFPNIMAEQSYIGRLRSYARNLCNAA